jgi:hypothetical protein
MQIVHLDLFGPCKQSSFAGHSYCCVFVDDHSHYTWVYTVKNKSEVVDVFKKFYADTAIIRSKYPWLRGVGNSLAWTTSSLYGAHANGQQLAAPCVCLVGERQELVAPESPTLLHSMSNSFKLVNISVLLSAWQQCWESSLAQTSSSP